MAKENIKGFLTSFKEFISKGNIIDMAVGVVIGGSFSKIVTGLVTNILNPFVALFVKSGSLDSVKTIITPAVLDESGNVVTAEVAILWGTWAQSIIDFLITAICMFLILRVFLKAKDRFNAKNIELEKQKAQQAEEEKEKQELAQKEAEAQQKEKQARLEQSVLEQEKLLCEIRDALKQK